MMQCKHCKTRIEDEELHARFRAGIGHCPNPECEKIDWELTRKYGRIISRPAEFERTPDETLPKRPSDSLPECP